MKALLFIILFLSATVHAACETGYNETGYTCIDIDALGNENYGIELCEAYNGNCTDYQSNQTLPLNITKDYIIKLTPPKIAGSRGIVNFLTSYTVWEGLLIVILMFMVILAILRLVSE